MTNDNLVIPYTIRGENYTQDTASFAKIKMLSEDKNMSFSISALYTWYRNTLRHPKYRWWLILGTAAYLFSPFDISPDFLPVVGQIDDVMLVTLLVSEVSQLLIERFKEKQAKEAGVAGQDVAMGTDEPKSSTIDVDAAAVK